MSERAIQTPFIDEANLEFDPPETQRINVLPEQGLVDIATLGEYRRWFGPESLHRIVEYEAEDTVIDANKVVAGDAEQVAAFLELHNSEIEKLAGLANERLAANVDYVTSYYIERLGDRFPAQQVLERLWALQDQVWVSDPLQEQTYFTGQFDIESGFIAANVQHFIAVQQRAAREGVEFSPEAFIDNLLRHEIQHRMHRAVMQEGEFVGSGIATDHLYAEDFDESHTHANWLNEGIIESARLDMDPQTATSDFYLYINEAMRVLEALDEDGSLMDDLLVASLDRNAALGPIFGRIEQLTGNPHFIEDVQELLESGALYAETIGLELHEQLEVFREKLDVWIYPD